MKVLLVSRYKNNFHNHILPFVYEQGEALRNKGVDIDYFLIQGGGWSGYFAEVKALERKIEQFKPDLIHAHYGLSGVTAVLQNKIPVVTTFHNGETLSKAVNFLTSLAAKKAAYTVCVARHIYDKLYFKPTRYCIMPCGLTLEDFPIQDHIEARKKLGFKDDTKYILFGGEFSNLRKNFPLLRDAVGYIKSYKVDVLEMRGLKRSQVNDLMFACDAFCLPSKSEGSPQALKEAMACNCPIVATDVADVKYLLGDIEGHYICDFDAKDLANKLIRAFDYGKRTDGRSRIIELGLDNSIIAEKLLGIYKDVINK